jgi:hypothetical protein
MNKRIREIISECQFELATNFDFPVISIISHHAARLGMTREELEKLVDTKFESIEGAN